MEGPEAPATPVSPAPAPSPFRRLGRALWLGLVALLVCLLALVGLGASPWGAPALASLLQRLSADALQLDGASGSLAGTFHLDGFRYAAPGLRLEGRDLDVDWQPAALLQGRLHFNRLELGRLALAHTSDDQPLQAPASLALPLRLRVEQLRLGELALRRAGQTQDYLNWFELAGTWYADASRHQFTALQARSPWGMFHGALDVDTQPPFAVHAQASLKTHQLEQDWVLKARAEGPLAALPLSLQLHGAGLDGQAQSVLTPFSPAALAQLDLRFAGLDPQRFVPQAPSARLDGEARLDTRAGQLRGPVRISNHTSGAWDQGRLPVEQARAQLDWDGRRLGLEALALSLPGQGRLEGRLRWAPGEHPWGQAEAELQVHHLDARALHRRALATRLDGQLRLDGEGARPRLDAHLQDAAVRLDLALALEGQSLNLEQLKAASPGGRLEARGRLALAGTQDFQVEGQVRQGNPARLWQQAPGAELNLDFRAAGQRSPSPRVQAQLTLAPGSRYREQPLEGRLAGQWQPGHWQGLNLDVALGPNRLQLEGAYGRPDDGLTLQLDAPTLATLGLGLGGSLQASGQLQGLPGLPVGRLKLQGRRLVYQDWQLGRLEAEGQLGAGPEGVVQLVARLEDGQDRQRIWLPQARLEVQGQRRAHQLQLTASQPEHWSLDTRWEGGWEGGLGSGGWTGRIMRWVQGGAVPLRLQAPASLSLSPEGIQLGAAELRGAADGVLRLEETRWSPGTLVARGQMSGLLLGLAVEPSTRAVRGGGDSLRLGARWDLSLGERLNGQFALFREGGDLRVTGDSPVQLGLDELQLTLAARDNRLALGFGAHGSQLGRLAGSGSALAERDPDGGWRLVPEAPLNGAARLEIPSLAWAGPLVDQNLKTEGRLEGVFSLAGTPSHPDAQGQLRGDALGITLADQGLHLNGGTLAATFRGGRLHLERLAFSSTNRVKPQDRRIDLARLTRSPGSLDVLGALDLASGAGHFEFQAARLPLLQRPDQWLMLSGKGSLETTWDSARLQGRLTADAGYVALAQAPAPSLGDDVEVRWPHASGRNASPFRMSVDLGLALGDAVYVDALGLDTRLVGELQLLRSPGRPLEARGSIQTQGGVFEGYGQKLSIEQGLLTFNGPVNNPALQVVALRKGLSVEAGVGISGTAKRPRVRLVSEPNVPDPEKLGWIVLGRPPDQGSGGELALLMPAARALLGGTGEGISTTLARSLGLDEVSVGASGDSRNRYNTSSVASTGTSGTASSASSTSSGSTVAGQVLTLGKRLSERATLSFEQSVSGASSVVKLSYLLTRNLSVIGRAGSENALDALFSLSFR
jgi:translocation and assembly module TamB